MKTKHSKLVDNDLVLAVTEEELASDFEADKIEFESKGKMMPQKLETSQSTDRSRQIESWRISESSNSISDLDLIMSLQKMQTEEQALIEQKQHLVATEQNLHNKLVEEVEKKQATIALLKSEITDLQKMTKQLGEALGIDSFNRTQVVKINSPILIDTNVKQDLPHCVGLLNCSKPEKCRNYDLCLNKYMAAEMRNDVLDV